MSKAISQVLHEFLTARRILSEVARRLDMKLSTLASELNPKCENAKFGLDDFEKLCSAIREIGYSGEMDSILHEYFETLNDSASDTESSQNLALLSADLMAKTAALADSTMKLLDSSDDTQLRALQALIRSELLPTSMRLIHIIDHRIGKENTGDEPIPQTT